MTRKDYVVIAKAFATTRPSPTTRHRINQWDADRYSIAIELQRDNPRFDMDRFLRATLTVSDES
jgi:hypothetical protein